MEKQKRQQKILVPVDGSPASAAAMKLAGEFAAMHGSDLVVLNVIEPVPTLLDFFAEKELKTERQKYASDLLDKHIKEYNGPEVPISKMIQSGKAYKAIVDASEEILAEMIFIGAWGLHAAGSGLVGSNVYKIVRTAKCPVITVPHDRPNSGLSKILIPADPDYGVGELERILYQYREQYSPTIDLVTVVHDKEDAEEEMKYLKRHQKRLTDAGVKDVHISVIEGKHPGRRILEHAFAEGHDMIWMETHGRTGLAGFFLGSVTEEVLSAGLLPILSLHPEREPSRNYYYHANLPI